MDVSKMKTGFDIMGIREMTEGISSAGMKEYKTALRAHLLTTTTEKINDTQALENAINAGWQGNARDKFLRKFDQMRSKIADDLKDEFGDLSRRLLELEDNYFAQDDKMIEII